MKGSSSSARVVHDDDWKLQKFISEFNFLIFTLLYH